MNVQNTIKLDQYNIKKNCFLFYEFQFIYYFFFLSLFYVVCTYLDPGRIKGYIIIIIWYFHYEFRFRILPAYVSFFTAVPWSLKHVPWRILYYNPPAPLKYNENNIFQTKNIKPQVKSDTRRVYNGNKQQSYIKRWNGVHTSL